MYNVSIRIKDVDARAKILSREVVSSVFCHCGSSCTSMCCIGLCSMAAYTNGLFSMQHAPFNRAWKLSALSLIHSWTTSVIVILKARSWFLILFQQTPAWCTQTKWTKKTRQPTKKTGVHKLVSWAEERASEGEGEWAFTRVNQGGPWLRAQMGGLSTQQQKTSKSSDSS